MRQAIAAALLGLLASLPATAADSHNEAATYSPGSCQEYLNARYAGKTTFFKGWLSGWISAHDRLMPNTYSLVIDDEQLVGPLSYLEDWCNRHPLADFVDGAGDLIDALYPKRQKEAPNQ
jgi:hypothetical protein